MGGWFVCVFSGLGLRVCVVGDFGFGLSLRFFGLLVMFVWFVFGWCGFHILVWGGFDWLFTNYLLIVFLDVYYYFDCLGWVIGGFGVI